MLLNFKLWAVLAAIVALAASHYQAYVLGGDHIRADWSAERAAIAKQTLRLSEQATRVTTDLQTKADAQKEASHAKIVQLNADLAVALGGLSDRAARDHGSNVPALASAQPASCTGASLWRDDAEFLTRLAAQADEQRLQLIECQTRYSEARQALMFSSK